MFAVLIVADVSLERGGEIAIVIGAMFIDVDTRTHLTDMPLNVMTYNIRRKSR